MQLLSLAAFFAKQNRPTNRAIDYIPAYIVHDDQAGPYMWLATSKAARKKFSLAPEDAIRHFVSGRMVELNVEDNAVFAVALMPTRVFSTAQAAEITATDVINEKLNGMPNVRKKLSAKQSSMNERLMAELESAHKKHKIVLRTYLTSAPGYRRHLANGTASDEVKKRLAWATFATFCMGYGDFHSGFLQSVVSRYAAHLRAYRT